MTRLIDSASRSTGKPAQRATWRLHPLAAAVLCATVGATIGADTATAQDEVAPSAVREARHRFDIPAGPLDRTLTRLGEQSGVMIAADSRLTADIRAPAIRGDYSLAEALRRALADTPLEWRVRDNEVTVVTAEDDALDPIRIEAAAGAAGTGLDPVSGYNADFSTSLTRTPTARQETPASIGVVTRDFIDDTGARKRDEALEQIAGVSRGGAIRGEQGVTIRGFSLPERSQRINGLAVRDSRPLDTAVIERIEVPRGPSSILTGAGSPGGSFNIVTKRPQPEAFARVEQDIGSFGLFRTTGDFNGPLTSTGNVRGRIAVASSADDGNFVDDTESSEITLAPSLEVDTFSGTGRLRLATLHQDFDGNTFRGVPLMDDGDGAPDIDPETNVGGGDDNGAFNDFESDGAQVQYDQEFINGLQLTARAGYQSTEQEVADVYAFQFGGGIPDSGDINIYASERTLDKESVSAEAFVTRSFNTGDQRHDIVVGADYTDQKRDATLAFAGPETDNIFDLDNDFSVPASGFTPFTDRTFELEQVGVFGQAVVRPVAGLTLVAGVRNDDAEFSSRARVRGVDAEVDESETTSRFGLSYAINPAVNLYGAFQESFDVQNDLEADGEIVPPETGESIELGAKFDLLEGRLGATVAVFRTDREDVASPDPDNPGFSILTGEQRHEGVEIEVNGEVTRGLRLSAQWSLLDAEITDDADFEGNSPPGVPDSYVGRIFTLYSPQGDRLADWSFGGGVFFHSGFVIDSANEFETDSFERLDLVAKYAATRDLDLQLNIENVTDEEFIENPGTSSANNKFGRPLSATATLRYRF